MIAWTSFDRDRIRSLVSKGKTVFVDVTAGWTRPDPAIGAYFASHGRYGTPFDIV